MPSLHFHYVDRPFQSMRFIGEIECRRDTLISLQGAESLVGAYSRASYFLYLHNFSP